MSYSRGSSFNTQHWYESLMETRTREAIEQKRIEYEQEHEHDTDAMLLAAIRARAAELGYTPFPAETYVQTLVIRRFGSWERALRLAHLGPAKGAKRLRETKLYAEELRRQQQLHREERDARRADLEPRRAGRQSHHGG